MTQLGAWVAEATAQLRTSDACDTPDLDAQLIASHTLGISRTRIFAFPETPIAGDKQTALDALLHRRLSGEPLAYITGSKEFWSMPLHVSPGTLVPRGDTEILVEKALQMATVAPAGMIAELGTGTGAIAIALATELPDRTIIAVERSDDALKVAQRNVQQHASNRVQLLRGSWLNAICDNSIAMIVSNPPYLAADDPHLPDLTYEPTPALVSGPTGLEDLEHIFRQARRCGVNGAPLIVEHGCSQGEQVRTLLLHYGYADVGTSADLAGLDRVSFGINSR